MAPALRIAAVGNDRERYRDLLLLADEQWDMVELYLHRGEMFAAYAEDDPCFKIDSAQVMQAEVAYDRAYAQKSLRWVQNLGVGDHTMAFTTVAKWGKGPVYHYAAGGYCGRRFRVSTLGATS